MTQHQTPRRHSTRRIVVASIAAGAIGLTGGTLTTRGGASPTTTAAATIPATQQPSTQQPSTQEPSTQEPPVAQWDDTASSSSEAADATDAQEVGLVYVTTTLAYGSGEAAGTGMVLTADGEILTNHHVVEGATSISVEVVSTGRTYDAAVVGYDATHDVAVLQLEGASGLTPVTTDTSQQLQAGDAVTGVGNAGGDGGAASAASGTVVALDQAITVQSETGGAASRLTGLIEVDADIVAGDSGGALYDSDGEVVGMDTAASSGAADITGYAVPIAQALSIADRIESGTPSDTVTIGNHGYLGITLSSQVTGALVAGVVADSPAAAAGLTPGSTVTGLDGAAITSADALSEAVSALAVGDRATVAWTDSSGQAHTETVTLGDGPVG